MRVLVVDDNATNCRLLSKFLTKWGYEPVTCSTGEQALAYCEQQTPDLILMDIMMPGIGGQQAARQIKQLHGSRHIPIIYVTALKEDQALADSLQAGGDDYVTKPIDQEILFSKIAAHRRIKQLNDQLEASNRQLQLHNRRLEREHELVQHFFERQERLCDLDASVLHYYTSAASAFNGDILFAKRCPQGGANILLGDFTGHGLTAAMGSLPVSEIFLRLTAEGASLQQLVTELNRCLYDLLPSEIFLAASVLQISPDGRRLNIWAGGLPAAFLRRAASQGLHTLESRHLPLGILDASHFDAQVLELDVEHGDCLYLCTDGLIEAVDAEGTAFGETRLLSQLQGDADHAIERIRTAVAEFIGVEGQGDDISVAQLRMAPLSSSADAGDQDRHSSWRANYPLSVETCVDVSAMRSSNALSVVVDMLASSESLRPFKGILYTIIAELYTNALEHGLLGLDSSQKRDDRSYLAYYQAKQAALEALSDANIRIGCRLEEDQDRVSIQVCHNGHGRQQHRPVPADGRGMHGWGLNIVANLCTSVDFRDEGRCVEVIYDIAAHRPGMPH